MSPEFSEDGVWLFAYGSLIWRPGFDYERRVRGVALGWTRRFWQGSSDHRGTREQPGRVATLVPEQGTTCFGVAYRISRDSWQEISPQLNERERGGYRLVEVSFDARDREHRGRLQAFTYVADEDNRHFLGPAAIEEMARQIASARGASGHNAEYVLRLAEALEELNAVDAHVFELANLLVDSASALPD